VNREFIAEHFGSPEEYKVFLAEYIKNRHLDDDFRKYIQGLEG